MGLFDNTEEEREKRWAAEAKEREAYHSRLKAESDARAAEIRAEEDRHVAARTSSLIWEAKRLVKSGEGDAIIELIRLYEEAYSEGCYADETIKELINSYSPPEDKENIQLYFKTLSKHEEYIKDFIKKTSPTEGGRFYKLWESLCKKGDEAWDVAFKDYKHKMTAEEEAALEDIRQLKNSTGTEVLKKMIEYYDRFCDPKIHGTRKDDQSPAAKEALTYILDHQAPTDLAALEEYANYVVNHKTELIELQKRHGLMLKGYPVDSYIYVEIGKSIENPDNMWGKYLQDFLLKKVDKAIKTGNHKQVTTGAIGQRNAHNKTNRYWLIGCGAVALIALILFIISIAMS